MAIFNVLRYRFGTIRWKLAGTYMLVSLGLALTLITIFVAAILWLLNSNVLLNAFADSARDLALRLRPSFEDPYRSAESLGYQLRLLDPASQPESANRSRLVVGNNDPGLTIDTATRSDMSASLFFVALLDQQGRIITSTLPINYPSGRQLASLEPPPAGTLIANALQGITTTVQIAAWSQPERHPLAVAPVFSRDGAVIGAVYTRVLNFPSASIVLASLPPFLLAIIIPWLSISGAVGLLYAWVAGRDFSRRLKRLTEASAALANGDLSPRVDDQAADEIGQLARQFNTMADQLTENLRALRMMADRNAQLAEQAAQLAKVEERNRLSRDLHDSVSQELFSLTMLAAAANRVIGSQPALAATQLAEIQTTAQRALQETRSLILALRPAMLDGRGLGMALHDLAAATRERQGLHIDLSISGERRLPLDHEQALFRIVQEALANVVRHSGVRQAQVTLQYSDEQVCLTISDQGQGFDPSAPRNALSIGLHSMAERSVALGGHFHVASAPGQGTTVMVTIPVDERALR